MSANNTPGSDLSSPTSTLDTPVPRSRRSSHRSTRTVFSPSLHPSGWRAAAPGLNTHAQPLAASVSAVHVAAPVSASANVGGKASPRSRGSSAAAAASRAMQAAGGGSDISREGSVRRRSTGISHGDDNDNNELGKEQLPALPQSNLPSSSHFSKARRPSTSTISTPLDSASNPSVDTQTTAAVTIIQPSASSSSTSWLASLTQAKGKQPVRSSPTSTPIAEDAAEPLLMPTTNSSAAGSSGSSSASAIGADTGTDGTAASAPIPIPSPSPISLPAPPVFHVHPPTPALEQGPATPPRSTTPTAATSTTPVQTPPEPGPVKKRSWFASPTRSLRGSVPSSPSKASLASTLPSLSSLTSTRTQSVETPEDRPETTRAPTPPPLPKTPPPTYPLELQLEVDSVVDATAMRPATTTTANNEDEGEEPPVYTPSERAPESESGTEKGATKGKKKEAPEAVASTPQREENVVEDPAASVPASGKETVGSVGVGTFVLAFPLLGRTKVPLGIGRGLIERASKENLGKEKDVEGEKELENRKDIPSATRDMQVHQGDHGPDVDSEEAVITTTASRDPISPSTSSLSTSPPDPSPTPVTHSQAQTPPQALVQTQTDSPLDPHPPEPAHLHPPSSDAGTHASPSSISSATAAGGSWWDYVGWGLTHPAPAGVGAPASTLKSESEAPVETQESEAARLARETEERESEHQKEEERIKREQEEKNKLAALVNQAQAEEVSPTITTTTISPTNAPTTTTTTAGELSTWLSPWSWYYSSATNTSTAGQAGASTDASTSEGTGEKEVLDATPVASIDDTPNPPTLNLEPILPPASHSAPEPVAEPINPISASFASNKSGWASFFNSQALIGRTLGYGVGAASRAVENVQRDENGVEVMEVDFDEDGPEKSADAQVEISGMEDEQTQRGRGGETKPVGGDSEMVLRSTSHSGNRVSSAPASTRHSSSRVTSIARAPPLKISPDVRKDSARLKPAGSGSSSKVPSASTTPVRGRSPAMSHTRSASSGPAPTSSTMNTVSATTSGSTSTTTPTPATTTTTTTTTTATRPASPTLPAKKPAPPNLVLPTWADTFLVAPRSVPLPKPKITREPDDTTAGGGSGVLGKTLQFMNNVLFAKDTLAAQAAGYVHSHSPSITSKAKSASATKGKGKERARRGVVQRTFSSSSTGSDDGEAGNEGERLSLIEQDRRARFAQWGRELPKAWSIVNRGNALAEGMEEKVSGIGVNAGSDTEAQMEDVLRGCRRVVIIGVHGWFPGTMIRTVLGEPTGTSTKFANMMEQALHTFEIEHEVHLEKITKIPLEGDGTIARRVDKLYANLLANSEWIEDLHAADAVLIATHSQGCVVSTHLLDRLIRDGHIVTARSRAAVAAAAISTSAQVASAMDAGGGMAALALGSDPADEIQRGDGGGVTSLVHRDIQRICMLALCGIHLGPLRYLSSSTLVGPYLQYFESTAARELFEFQNTESAVSKAYVAALNTVLDHGTKIVYVASLNDQVVPIYSGLFTAISHPLILRALYIDGDAYHSSDFLSNLLVLLLRILNAGMSDSGLLAHLSEATAGSLNGVGHSTAYEEVATYSLAVRYLFLANEGATAESKMEVEPFNATQEQNDYEIPWSLREVIADERVTYFFGKEIACLRDAFREWQPKTTILRDLKRKLQPIQRLSSTFSTGTGTSKL